MTEPTGDLDGVDLNVQSFVEGEEFYLRVTASGADADPASFLLIGVNTTKPNALIEMDAVTSILQTEFMSEIDGLLAEMVLSASVGLPPEVIAAVAESAAEGMMMQGVSREEAEAAAERIVASIEEADGEPAG